MNRIDCEQGSAEWFQWRLGCVTSSRVADAVAKLKKKEGESSARRRLRFELACELLTKRASDNFVSAWMERGTQLEPLARAEYELRNGVYVEQVGFVTHPTIKMAGASPDGLVGDSGLIEIKAPKIENHLQYILDDKVPEDYMPQMLWQMDCCERQWNDFVSYCPELPEGLDLFVKRLERTKEADAVIQGMRVEVEQFLGEVDTLLAKLQEQRKAALETA